jgi:hypothetical protein
MRSIIKTMLSKLERQLTVKFMNPKNFFSIRTIHSNDSSGKFSLTFCAKCCNERNKPLTHFSDGLQMTH